MTSTIDATKPVDGVPADKADLRANFSAAKAEIIDLQETVTAVTGAQVVAGYTIVRDSANMFIDIAGQTDDGTVTLPASPVVGDRILIRRGSGDFECLVNGTFAIVEDGTSLFLYDGSAWLVVHFNVIDATAFATAAQGALADTALQLSDISPTQVASNASPYLLPLSSRADFGVEVPTHTTNVEFVVPKTAPGGSEWHVVVGHSGCYAVVEDDAGSIGPNMALNTSGDATESKRMVIGGEVIVRVRSNAGAAPVVVLLGDVDAEDVISGNVTIDEDQVGRLVRYNGTGSPTWTINASNVVGEVGVENDGTGTPGDITFSAGTVSVLKGASSVAKDKMASIRYFNGGAEAHIVAES